MGGTEGGGIHPIFQVIMPELPPRATIDEINLVCHRGADALKRRTEIVVPFCTKYTDSQLVHLLSFCGLQSNERDMLPKIWTSLQTTKDWYRASTELTK